MRQIRISECENYEWYLIKNNGWSESGYDIVQFEPDGFVSQSNGGIIDTKFIEAIYKLPY